MSDRGLVEVSEVWLNNRETRQNRFWFCWKSVDRHNNVSNPATYEHTNTSTQSITPTLHHINIVTTQSSAQSPTHQHSRQHYLINTMSSTHNTLAHQHNHNTAVLVVRLNVLMCWQLCWWHCSPVWRLMCRCDDCVGDLCWHDDCVDVWWLCWCVDNCVDVCCALNTQTQSSTDQHNVINSSTHQHINI
jgi:hypothetical protein